MKKLFTIASVMAALTGVATAAPYVLPSPQPGALTPYDMQPHYGIDAIYTISGDSDVPDVYGARLSFNLYTSGSDTVRHQFSVNVTPQYGEEDVTVNGYKVDEDLFMMPITLGYDLNLGLTDSVLVYVGGKAGYALTHNKFKVRELGYKESDDDGGFNFSVGGGLKFQASDAILIKLGYEFGKTYIDTSDDSDSIYTGHSIILGVSCQF